MCCDYAQAACDHMKSWFSATPEGDWVSMGVFSDGSYGTPNGVMFSFPVTIANGRWSIVQVGVIIPVPVPNSTQLNCSSLIHIFYSVGT